MLTGACAEPEVQVLAAAYHHDAWHDLEPLGPFPVVDGYARVEVAGLAPATPHSFALGTVGGAGRSLACHARTAPGEADAPIVRLGATCCLGNTNKRAQSLAVAAQLDLDALILHGDAIYTQASTLEGYRARYSTLLDKDSFRALLATTPLVALWDDHEVANDWLPDRIPEAHLQAATQAYLEALPQRVGSQGSGMWRSLRYGRTVELFLLDTRGERTDDDIVSSEQLDWVIAGLQASPCTHKIVVTTVHITDHALRMSKPGDLTDIANRWQGFPRQRTALLQAAEAVDGVVFLTGDAHYGGLQGVGADGDVGADLWEIAAGPAGSATWDVEGWMADRDADVSQYDTLVQTWNLVVLTIDPSGILTVDFLGDDGQLLASRVLG